MNDPVFGVRTPSWKTSHMQRLYNLMENWSKIMETGGNLIFKIVGESADIRASHSARRHLLFPSLRSGKCLRKLAKQSNKCPARNEQTLR